MSESNSTQVSLFFSSPNVCPANVLEQIVFWSCDDEGRLYHYSKLRKYRSEILDRISPLSIISFVNVSNLLLLTLLTLNPKAQADAILDVVGQMDMVPDVYHIALDSADHLWFVEQTRGSLYAWRFDTKGKSVIDNLQVGQKKENVTCLRMDSELLCDRFNTCWFVYSGLTDADSVETIYLARLTPDGMLGSHSPWEKTQRYHHYLDLADDTLIVMRTNILERSFYDYVYFTRIALTEDNYHYAFDTSYTRNDLALVNIVNTSRSKDFSQAYLDWAGGRGLRAEIYWYREHPDRGPLRVHISGLHLTPAENFLIEGPQTYAWLDYEWRTYKKAWMRHITFSPHEDGGYILCLPDLDDRSITHMLRLDFAGVPVDPDSLAGGGRARAKPFKKLPHRSQAYADVVIYQTDGKLDSARVLYWGVDEGGSIYSFRRVREY